MQAKVIRILTVLCVFVALSYTASAQRNRALRHYVDQDGWSIGTNIGMSDMWGDVGTKGAIDHYTNSKYLDKVTFIGGMHGRYNIHPTLALRFMLNFGSIYASDVWNYDGALAVGLKEGTDYVQRYLRAQNAKATIFEAGMMLEVYPRRFNLEGQGAAYRRGQPFLAGGLVAMHYTPYSTVANTTTFVKTYELSLEGQGWGGSYPKRNSRWQPAIPLAIGWRWDIGQHLNLGLEYMYRMTMFDYLDGVSGKYISQYEFKQNLSESDAKTAILVADKQLYYNNSLPSPPGTLRGNPGNNDSYSTFSILFSYKVPARNRIWWRHKQM